VAFVHIFIPVTLCGSGELAMDQNSSIPTDLYVYVNDYR